MSLEQADRYSASLDEEGRYRLLVEAVTDYAIYMLDLDGRVSSWNAGARRFKGYEPAEIIGQHFSRFYTEEDKRDGLPARALRISAEEGRFENEGWRVRKDGTRFWANVVIDPIHDTQGRLIGYAKVTRDLTERRQAEEALRQSEEEFKLLVQGVTDYAIYMLDPSGVVSNWNLGAERIKGYRPDEIVGQHFSRFYTDEDRERGAPELALLTARTEGRFEKEGWRVRKDGTRFWASVVIDPIRRNGEIIGYAKITRDMTERMQAQQALEQARQALFQSQKMESLGQLTGGIAHDFNNLLMAVLGSLELAWKRLPDDPKLRSLIDNAVQGAQRGATLTQRMLAFARRQDLKSEAIDVPGLVGGMKDLLQRAVGPSITVEATFPHDLPIVQADANQLEMALLNLAVNARDAISEQGVIQLVAHEETVTGEAGPLPAGRYVRIAVTDSGEGMDEDTLTRATEPFFTTKGAGKGTGLGLSMIHGMAEQVGGRLVLKSSKGEGTTAELWLPVSKSSLATEREASVPDQMRGPVRPLKVLAVDDDALVLMNTTAMLEDLGHTVLPAVSGEEALAILAGVGGVDLMIVDYAMPHMTGLQLAQTVRTRWPSMPIILATGYAELPPETSIDLPRLAKPFRQGELARAIGVTSQPALPDPVSA